MASWFRDDRWAMRLLAVSIPWVVFGTLAVVVARRESFAFDEPILLFLRRHATPFLDQIMLFLSRFVERFGVYPLDGAVLVLLLLERRSKDTIFWILAIVGNLLINPAAKAAFARARPELWPSLAPLPTFSFPSGHAMSSMAFVAALSVLSWRTRWRWPAVLAGSALVASMGLSRVYLGVHYPSDVVGGWAAALGWVLLVSLICYGELGRPRPAPSSSPPVERR